MKFNSILMPAAIAASILAGVFSGTAHAQTFSEVQATWFGNGAEPSMGEFADIACQQLGYNRASNYSNDAASGVIEQNGRIGSFMLFSSVTCE